MKTDPTPIHIGQIIKEKLHQQGRTAHWLADQIPCTRTHIYKIFKTPNINTELLLRISDILEYNFFQHFVD